MQKSTNSCISRSTCEVSKLRGSLYQPISSRKAKNKNISAKFCEPVFLSKNATEKQRKANNSISNIVAGSITVFNPVMLGKQDLHEG